MSPQTKQQQSGPPAEQRGVVRILGVAVRLHFTFVLLAVFLIVSGVQGGTPAILNSVYILMLFASVLLHELGHAVTARRFGIRTVDITLYPIGGVARLERNPRPAEELWIALAGPAVNVVIAAALWGVMRVAPNDLLMRIATGNLILAAFNMIPAFPMDGGRVLRSVLSKFSPEEVATRRAATAGRALAILMALGGLVSGQFMLIFVALFVYLGATQETAAVEGRTLTHGVPVRDAMITDYRTLEHGNTIREAANLLLATSQHDFPVVMGGQVMGLLGRTALLRGMAEAGPDAYVAGIMDREYPRVGPMDELEEVLPVMAGTSCALVMDGERLVGLLTRENLSEFLILRKFGMEPARA
ncbi:MAG: site-2 protease family protein [Bryobacteraceae bacterium]|nr:site-2 protease family protein [Bryobacteraceae bacterium]